MKPDNPYWKRPIINCPHLGSRRAFWSELTQTQRDAEMDYELVRARALLAEIRRNERNGR